MMVENNGGITNKTRIFGKKIHHFKWNFLGFWWILNGNLVVELVGWNCLDGCPNADNVIFPMQEILKMIQMIHTLGGGFKYFLYVHSYLGKMHPFWLKKHYWGGFHKYFMTCLDKFVPHGSWRVLGHLWCRKNSTEFAHFRTDLRLTKLCGLYTLIETNRKCTSKQGKWPPKGN